nr:hypothetical protein [bacterium]
MKTLTWQKPGQQNVAQELIKIIINYVAELRIISFFASFIFVVGALLLPLYMKPTTKRISSFFLLLFCYPLLVIGGLFL